MHTAEAILTMNSPGDLFSNDEVKIKTEYRNLAKHWHPDINHHPRAVEVMKKVNDLYHSGVEMLKAGQWVRKNYIQFHTVDHKKIGITYLAQRDFELGKMYICNQSIVYVVEKKHQSFYENYIRRNENLSFPNDKMKDDFVKYLPHIQDRFETEEYLAIKVSKPQDVLSLRDVLTYYKGNMPDRHMAWVLSTLYNMACFLDYNKLVHMGLTVDNYFISPQYHSGVLLGGWWYTVGVGEKLTGAPKDVFNIITPKVKTDKKGHVSTDLDSIRQIGRELIGDKLGSRLLTNTTLPKPIIDWLMGGSVNKPIDEYTRWGETLDRGYGKRTFVEMKISSSDLYL